MLNRYFRFKGTLSSADFFQGFLGMCATGMFLGLAAGLGRSGVLFAACFIPMVAMILILFPLWISMRLRDAGYSPYWAILCVMPPFMAIIGMAAFFLPSASQPNA